MKYETYDNHLYIREWKEYELPKLTIEQIRYQIGYNDYLNRYLKQRLAELDESSGIGAS